MESEFIEMIEDMLNELKKSEFETKIAEAFKQPAKLSIEKDKYGKGKMNMEGHELAILITLAGLEKNVLESLNVPDVFWKMIKKSVETREEKDYEI